MEENGGDEEGWERGERVMESPSVAGMRVDKRGKEGERVEM